MLKRIKELAPKYHDRMVSLRRYFHSNPELAFEERKTSAKIKSELKRLKIGHKSLARTGVLGFMGKKSGPVCAIRSDMDALPIIEKTSLRFKSKNAGKMHACGHDIHMATVLGAAMILSDIKSELPGGVKFIFQPAEEVPPGGAIRMIKEGAMKNPPVRMVFGLHTDPNITAGKIGCREGVLMAEVLDFDITIKGRGGHGARPHDTIDSIAVTGQLITTLQTIVSRRIDPIASGVVTIGEISGGTARNVIASEVHLKGTIRATDPDVVQRIKKELETILRGVTQSYGAKFTLEYVANYPVLYNNPRANDLIMETAAELYGKKSVTILENPGLGGEDFARYLKYAPGAMFRLGIRNRKVGAVYQWHSDHYNSDENSMIYGSAVLAGAVVKFLTSKG